MCGICGYVSKKRITEEQLKIMNDTMYHRGPDDSGVEIYAGANDFFVGFAQRRLAILDLSPLGHQPMHSENGRISLVFNGEIYNFLELKEEIRDYIEKTYGYDLHRTWAYWHPIYGWEDSCQGTVPQAIIAFLDSTDFEDAIRKAVSLGGGAARQRHRRGCDRLRDGLSRGAG